MFDATTGAETWSMNLGGLELALSPDGATLYTHDYTTIYALDAFNGAIRSMLTTGSQVHW